MKGRCTAQAFDLADRGYLISGPHRVSSKMDSGDAASLVALIVALFALFVALAQVTQQYFATAQNMRKCDKSVWGPLPGHSGRRVWTWHQFRFRIVYDMPNIFVRLPDNDFSPVCGFSGYLQVVRSHKGHRLPTAAIAGTPSRM